MNSRQVHECVDLVSLLYSRVKEQTPHRKHLSSSHLLLLRRGLLDGVCEDQSKSRCSQTCSSFLHRSHFSLERESLVTFCFPVTPVLMKEKSDMQTHCTNSALLILMNRIWDFLKYLKDYKISQIKSYDLINSENSHMFRRCYKGSFHVFSLSSSLYETMLVYSI